MAFGFITAQLNRLKEQAKTPLRELSGGLVEPRVFSPALPLKREHVQNCKVIENRRALLEFLPKNSVCAEVGVLFGDFSQAIDEITKPRKFHLIDQNKDFLDGAVRKLSQNGIRNNLIIHHGLSWEMLGNFEDEFFDWIYLDADHTYEGVRKDAEVSLRKIKRNGLLVFNDYSFFDHIRDYKMGVVEVVNELCIHRNFELLYYALQDQMYCDVVLRRRDPLK